MTATEHRADEGRAEFRKILVAVDNSPSSEACSTASGAIELRDDEQRRDEAVRVRATSCTSRERSFAELPGCVGRPADRAAVQPSGARAVTRRGAYSALAVLNLGHHFGADLRKSREIARETSIPRNYLWGSWPTWSEEDCLLLSTGRKEATRSHARPRRSTCLR